MKSPFKFLDAYTREDREIFFGRDKDIEELYRRVFESKIMLVYGESGTGKSSLIQCGLANKFRDTDWLPLMIRRGENILTSITAAVKAAAVTPQQYEFVSTLLFKKAVRSLYTDHYKPLFFIFDQFEELFIFGSKDEKHAFVQFIQALSESDIECRFIFILREEYMASVSEFEKHIRGFLSNRIRIERMPHEDALFAIKGPCSVFDIDLEEGFAEKLLNKLSPDSPDIELTYLQVFLDKIFNLALKKKEEEKVTLVFTSDLLEKTGDVSDLLGSFLEEQISLMSDQDAALAVLKSFVSVKGTKRQLTAQEVKDNAYTLGKSLDEPALLEMIQAFVNLRILRDKDQSGRYELRHDALASKIFEKISNIEKEILEIRQFIENAYYSWQKRGVLLTEDDLKYIGPYRSRLYLSEELALFISRSEKALEGKRRRRRQLAIAIPSVVIVVLSFFTIWALLERNKSEANYIKAKASNYVMMAREIALTDPTKALRLTEYTMSLDSSEDVRKLMYQIYRENTFYKIIARLPGPVTSIAISPDGKYLLTGCKDGIARLMDLQGRIIKELKGHNGSVSCVAFSPGGDSVLTGSGDKNVILWKINGEILHRFIGHSESVTSVAFSPNGRKILTGSTDLTARLWDINGNLLHKYQQNFLCRTVSFSGDGKSFLTNADSLSPVLIDLDGKRIKTFTGHTQPVQRACFSPDFKCLISTSTDGTAILHNVYGKEITRFIGHENTTFWASFSRDGKKVLTTSLDNTIRVWNLDGEIIQVLKGHEDDVTAALFSPDGKTIYSVSGDGTVRSWELQNNTQRLFKLPKEIGIRNCSFSPVSNTLLLIRDKSYATLFDLHGNIIHDFRDPEGRIAVASFSDDGNTILTGVVTGVKRLARFYSLNGKELSVFRNITWAGFFSNSILFTSDSKGIKLYSLNGKFISNFKFPSQIFFPIPHKNSVLYGTSDGIIWQTDTSGNRLREFSGHKSMVRSIAFSSDSKLMLSGSNDKTAILWNTEGKPLLTLKGHSAYVKSVSISSYSQQLLTLDNEGVARLWDFAGNLMQVIKTDAFPADPLYGAFFSDDGQRILTVSRFAIVHLTDILSPLDDFLKRDNYEKLSTSQMIDLGIISFKEILKIQEQDTLSEAADWYFNNSELTDTDKKNEYQKNAFEIYNKLIESYPGRADYIIKLLKIYIVSYIHNQSEESAVKIELYNKKLIDCKSINDISLAVNFYASYLSPTDTTLTKLKLDSCLFSLSDKIVPALKTGNTEVSQVNIAKIREYSDSLIRKNNYKNGLKGLEICYAADSTNTYNIGYLSIAYLVNGKYQNAKRIIEKWKDEPFNTGTYADGFLWLIDNLESRGITNPDFKRAKELLKK